MLKNSMLTVAYRPETDSFNWEVKEEVISLQGGKFIIYEEVNNLFLCITFKRHNLLFSPTKISVYSYNRTVLEASSLVILR